MEQPSLISPPEDQLLLYEKQFKALADHKRLQILYYIVQKHSICVCDLCDVMDMPQSKLSYHLKILLDANLITKDAKGTWSYYQLNEAPIHQLLSPKLCSLFQVNR